jgi:hypothetical protein
MREAKRMNRAGDPRGTRKRALRLPRRRIEEDEPRERLGVESPLFGRDAAHSRDDLAEELGEGYVLSATSGGDGGSELAEEEVPEEEGGPFVETSGRIEFAHDVDESNPVDAEPAPLPLVSPMRKRPGR